LCAQNEPKLDFSFPQTGSAYSPNMVLAKCGAAVIRSEAGV